MGLKGAAPFLVAELIGHIIEIVSQRARQKNRAGEFPIPAQFHHQSMHQCTEFERSAQIFGDKLGKLGSSPKPAINLLAI